jgi:mercuric ion transport protein
VIGAFVICPCHLPLTLALAAALLGGTAAGAALRGHPIAAGTIITATWAAATWHGFRLMRRSTKTYEVH